VNERLEATVRGLVQGVGFRLFVLRTAARLGLTGWVANDVQGAVKVTAEGSPTALAELAGALRVGPAGALVESVDEVRMPATGAFNRFEVRAGGHPGD